jgi:nucleosome binding factor SPN SPT16 subunit
MQDECIKAMVPGKPLKGVYKAAVDYLQSSGNEELISKLPKTLGFSIGLDFRDPTLVLSPKNPATFRPGMVFSLVLGFSSVDLPENAKTSTSSKSAVSCQSYVCVWMWLRSPAHGQFIPPYFQVKAISNYALLISDMVVINKDGPDVLTKLNKSLTDISYTINDEEEGEGEESSDDDVEAPDAPEGDEAYARKVAKEISGQRQRSSARLAKDSNAVQEVQEGVAERERAQIALMARRNEERLRELARANSRNKGKGGELQKAEELEAYARTKDYPDNVLPNQVKVDMANQCVILPIGGNPVPFHISTIKNVVLPDPDNATYLRINFYSAGLAVGKDAPVNMAKLVEKYAPYASFIREMTFRSLDSHNLTQVSCSVISACVL